MAGALRLLARLHEAGSALRHLKVGYLLAIRSRHRGKSRACRSVSSNFACGKIGSNGAEAISSCHTRDGHGFGAQKLRAIRSANSIN
jgi:hypothetical protein